VSSARHEDDNRTKAGAQRRAVVIFDDRCQEKNHPDAEIRKLVYGS